MDQIEDNSRYPRKPFPPSSSSTSNRSKKFPLYPHHQQYPPVPAHFNRRDYLMEDENKDDDDDDEEEEEEEEEEEADDEEQFQVLNDDDESDQNDEDEDEDDDNYNPGSYNYERYPKRQKKMKSSALNYEFAPRVLAVPGGPEWSEHEKFVLLEVWGDRFLQLGRKSLRSEDWGEVAEKVSEAVKAERTVEQCRKMMDGLKRKYKKEMARGGVGGNGGVCKWGYFRKMDMLLGEVGGGSNGGVSLGCGVDAGEFVFMDTRFYLERANGNDEMRDSPCESEGEDEEEGIGGVGGGGSGVGGVGVKGLRVLADSVMRFGEIYEKIESSKRAQMVELERMRVEFEKDLESQKKLILERAQAEISKIREDVGGEEDDGNDDTDMDDEEDDGDGVYVANDGSIENPDE